MGIRNIQFIEKEYYHIYNRGVDKRIIFNEKRDYLRFATLLYLCNSTENVSITDCFEKGINFKDLLNLKRKKTLVEIGAWCLMPNHFHLLIRERGDGNISVFMQKLATAYSKYYNNKNERTGSLFEGKFKAKHIDNNNYLKYMFAYINLNPVKLIDSEWKESKIKNQDKTRVFLKKYKYSSYPDLIGESRIENKILNTKNFPKYFETFEEFKKFIADWLNSDEK